MPKFAFFFSRVFVQDLTTSFGAQNSVARTPAPKRWGLASSARRDPHLGARSEVPKTQRRKVWDLESSLIWRNTKTKQKKTTSNNMEQIRGRIFRTFHDSNRDIWAKLRPSNRHLHRSTVPVQALAGTLFMRLWSSLTGDLLWVHFQSFHQTWLVSDGTC